MRKLIIGLCLSINILPSGLNIENFNYTKSYNRGEISYNILSFGPRSIANYIVTASAPNDLYQTFTGISDPIVDSYAIDMNRDNNSELIFITQGAGSGSYGEVYLFYLDGDKFKDTKLPKLKRKLRNLYYGHDVFEVEADRIKRTFPIDKDRYVTITYTFNGVKLKEAKIEGLD